jgi:ankyrin repeat protein
VDVGNTAAVECILSRGDVDVDMVVSGATPLLLAAVQNYDVTALSLLRAGADHSHVATWGTALNVARKLGDEHLIPYHAESLHGDVVAGEVAPPAL